MAVSSLAARGATATSDDVVLEAIALPRGSFFLLPRLPILELSDSALPWRLLLKYASK